MKRFHTAFPLSLVARQLGLTPEVRFDTTLDNVAETTEANEHSLCFLEDPHYLESAREVHAGLLLVSHKFDDQDFPHANLLRCDTPYLIFVMMVRTWLQADAGQIVNQVAATAAVHPTAKLGENIRIGEYAVIGEGSEIGDNTVIEAHATIMENCRVGRACHIYPHVTLYPDTMLGDRVILHAGVVLGADGFGYVLYEGRQEKIPQVGRVVIDNDVEIGANTAIDRSTMTETRIGEGTKIDNLVQVGHNCHIGRHSILCAHVGLAGGTNLGDTVYIAGQVGTAGHLTIGDGAMIGAQSGVAGNVPAGARYLGTPALEDSIMKRIYISWRYLPDMIGKLRQLIKKHDE